MPLRCQGQNQPGTTRANASWWKGEGSGRRDAEFAERGGGKMSPPAAGTCSGRCKVPLGITIRRQRGVEGGTGIGGETELASTKFSLLASELAKGLLVSGA